MKFLFVIRYGNLGGTERATLDLIGGLRRQGHDCFVVITARVKALGPALEAENIKPISLERHAGTWSVYKGICKLSAEIQPDVFVQVGSRFATTLAAFASSARHKAYICHHHHQGEKSRLNWFANYAVVRRAFDSMVFVSDWLRREAVSFNVAVGRRAHVLYPPVTLKEPTTEAMRSRARELLALPQQAKIIGNAGRLMPVKRFDVFLKVAEKVANRYRRRTSFLPGKARRKRSW
jgi:glycosyltransferase involved in cell wall biosynthesis